MGAMASTSVKRLAKFVTTEDHETYTFEYDDETGRLVSYTTDNEYDGESWVTTYDYSRISEGIITTMSSKYDSTIRLNADGSVAEVLSYDYNRNYVYDNDGYCISIIRDGDIYRTLDWSGGDLLKVERQYGNYVDLYYTNSGVETPVPCVDNVVSSWLTMYAGGVSYPLEAIFASLVKGTKDYIAAVSEREMGSTYTDYYTVELDSDGYPVKIAQYVSNDFSKEFETFTFEWEDAPAGIHNTKADSHGGPDSYYTVDGRRIESPRRGVNIVRHADGSASKIIIR